MNRLFRPFKEGFKGIGRHFGISLSSVIAVTITLILVGVFLLINENVTTISSNIEKNVEIYVEIDREFDDQIVDIKTQVEQLRDVDSVRLVTREESLQMMIEEGGEGYKAYEGENNPLPNSMLVNVVPGSNIRQTAEYLEDYSWVVKTRYGGTETEELMAMMIRMRSIGSVFVVALGFLAILLITNTIKVSIESRAEEISIMRIVGATNWFIKAPFLVEGILIGLLGAVLPIAFVYFGYQALYNNLGGILYTNLFVMTPSFPMVQQISLILLATAIGVGMIGSFLSINKHLRVVR
ncbi:MAG TPA: ABC transporter permease [Erysipelothrix sp.]|nr:ABC transporter permease [Erysipelothrix sp.]